MQHNSSLVLLLLTNRNTKISSVKTSVAKELALVRNSMALTLTQPKDKNSGHCADEYAKEKEKNTTILTICHGTLLSNYWR